MQEAGRIMLIEDEVDLAELVRDYLLNAEYEVEMHHRGDGVVEAVRQSPPALMLLDLMLPGVDGMTICREVRQFSDVPIIMLTARVEEIDRLLGLEMGADDYICKPFKPREVVARVKAVLRRTQGNIVSAQQKGLHIDEANATASIDNQAIDLTQAEFRLLSVMASHPGRVFSRNQLMDAIYDDYRIVSDRTVDTHVKNLRRKLSGHHSDGELIHSVYGVGYKLEFI